MFIPSRLLRFSQRLSRTFSSSANPNPNPDPNPNPIPESIPNTTPTPTPNPNHLSNSKLAQAVDDLFKERDLDKLVSKFKKSSESHRFRCKHRIYEIAVRRLAAAHRFDSIVDILEYQKQFAEDISHEGFAVRLISLYGKARMPDHALSTFNHLPDLQCPRTVMSFNALLTAFTESNDTDRIATAFREIPESDPSIVPDLISYNILIGLFCEKGDLDAALNTVDLIERNGINTNVITFNIILNGFYSKNRFDDAEKVWALMVEKNIQPDVKSFNAKLRGLVSEGKLSEAVELVGELRRLGLKPDTYTFNALIKGHCEDGNLEEAKSLYLGLTKNDCAPNRATFETLVPRLCEAGELEMAIELCNESMSRRFFVDVGVLQEVVEGLVKVKRLEEAKKLVKLGRLNCYPRKSLMMPLP